MAEVVCVCVLAAACRSTDAEVACDASTYKASWRLSARWIATLTMVRGYTTLRKGGNWLCIPKRAESWKQSVATW